MSGQASNTEGEQRSQGESQGEPQAGVQRNGEQRVLLVQEMEKIIKGNLPAEQELREEPGRLVRLTEAFRVRLGNVRGSGPRNTRHDNRERVLNATMAIWRVLQAKYEVLTDMPEVEDSVKDGKIDEMVGIVLSTALGWDAFEVNEYLKRPEQRDGEKALESMKRTFSDWRALQLTKTRLGKNERIPFELKELQVLVERWTTGLTPEYAEIRSQHNKQRIADDEAPEVPEDAEQWRELAEKYDRMARQRKAWDRIPAPNQIHRGIRSILPVSAVGEAKNRVLFTPHTTFAPRSPHVEGRNAEPSKERMLRCWSCGQRTYTSARGCSACGRLPFVRASQGRGKQLN